MRTSSGVTSTALTGNVATVRAVPVSLIITRKFDVTPCAMRLRWLLSGLGQKLSPPFLALIATGSE